MKKLQIIIQNRRKAARISAQLFLKFVTYTSQKCALCVTDISGVKRYNIAR